MSVGGIAIETLVPKPYGKILLADFAWGYVLAYEKRRGRGPMRSALLWAASQHCSDRNICNQWLEPLHIYLVSGKDEYQSLDYGIIALLYEGLIDDYQQKPDVGVEAMREIGKNMVA